MVYYGNLYIYGRKHFGSSRFFWEKKAVFHRKAFQVDSNAKKASNLQSLSTDYLASAVPILSLLTDLSFAGTIR